MKRDRWLKLEVSEQVVDETADQMPEIGSDFSTNPYQPLKFTRDRVKSILIILQFYTLWTQTNSDLRDDSLRFSILFQFYTRERTSYRDLANSRSSNLISILSSQPDKNSTTSLKNTDSYFIITKIEI